MSLTELAELKKFLDALAPEELEQYAKDCGTSAAYLMQLKGGHRRASTKLARTLVAKSGGGLRLQSVRPDVWGQEHVA
jgi:hypothetical protein